jgi:hypothetical protein
MRTPKNDRLSTADLARGAGAHENAPSVDEQVVNRGIAEPVYGDVPESARQEAPHEPARDRPDTRRQDEQTRAAESARDHRTDLTQQLFANDEMMTFRRRWSDIQAGFVDEPRAAVQRADSLVAETMQQLANVFAHAREQLEHQWDRGEDVTTEDLRVALQRYRAFFDRLLSV